MEGHAATHVPEERKDVAVAVQFGACWKSSAADDAAVVVDVRPGGDLVE